MQQDLKKIEALYAEKSGYTDEEFEDLLKNRNLAWMKILPEIMNKQTAFIAVGAGHLIDQWGLINLLRKSGYTVKPINTN
ncbi:hypothetical protein EZ449_01180 [Pedobacter frigidisoli]|uniref:TraB family protein n=1 Tax=Pedobacter frigidisoli TaxID=2530455 RepID=A0A4V2MNF7_9SPHI|nr:hypothetical protein EZ449_01180 [Pedobacter frigidisoli]